MSRYTDPTLIELLKSSNPAQVDQALRYLCTSLQASVIQLLRSRSVPLEDAKDAFNESLFVLVKNAQKGLLDQEKTELKPYLIAICKRKAAQQYKRTVAQRTSVDTEQLKQLPSTEYNQMEKLLDTENRSLLQQLMEQLGKDCKRILLGFYYYKQRMQELAQQLNYANEQVARNKKARCMKRLKKMISESEFYRDNLQ